MILKMDIQKIKNANTNYLGKNVIYFEEIDSTQEEAKRILITKKNKNGTIILADKQTKGIGTKGRVWHTNKSNIAMTMIFYPNCNIDKLEGITILIAEKMLQTIKELYGYELKIKQPNDLFLNNKKIGGILTQTSTVKDNVQYLLIGMGFNVNEEKLPKELMNIATSLKIEYKRDFNIENIICNFIEKLEKELPF